MSLRTIAEDGMTAVLNEHFRELHGLKPLRWTIDTTAKDDGHFHVAALASSGDYDLDESLEVIEAWASALGLERDWTSQEGTVYYRGVVDAGHVLVWAVTDHAAFYGDQA